MNASDFAKGLADRVGKEHNQILIFDRALAEAGLRDKARGRHAPDVTCQEAIMLLLSFLSGRPAQRAARAASDLANFGLFTGADDAPLKTFHYLLGIENSFDHLIKKSLAEILAQLCKRIAAGKLGEDNFVWLEVRDGVTATLQAELNWLPDDRSQKLGLNGEIEFMGVVDVPIDSSRGNYFQTRTVSSRLLGWIGEVTA